jgi:hypothetical protein
MRSAPSSGIEWGHLALVLLFAALTAAYLYDSWSASSALENLILIAPGSMVALGLCAIIIIGIFRGQSSRAYDIPRTSPDEPWVVRHRVTIYIVLFGLYALGLETVGYDLATILFVAAALVLHGERRPVPLTAFSLGFSGIVVWAFKAMLSFPMKTAFL